MTSAHADVREEARTLTGGEATGAGGSRMRQLPVPSGLSEEAQVMLAAPPFIPPPYPGDRSDYDAWMTWVKTLDEIAESMFVGAEPPPDQLRRTELDFAGLLVHELVPGSLRRDQDAPLFIDVHGGGFLLGGGALAWREAAPRALQRDGITWAPDYRMPPRHPFPTGLDDLVAVYREALAVRPSSRIVVAGASAGGNLAAALILRAHAEGLPMPAALVLLSPHLDLSESGDSFVVNAGVDPILTASLEPASRLYAAGRPLTDPLVSPLFGDLREFPPTLLQAGTRDLMLSNAVRMHRALLRAGAETELHVFEAMPHVAFTGTTPEDEEVRAQVHRFETQHLR